MNPILPDDAAVPGGLEGLKRGLLQGTFAQRIEGLRQAMNYGEAGVDVVVATLEDEYSALRHEAYGLLKDSADARVKQAVAKYKDELRDDFIDIPFDDEEEYRQQMQADYRRFKEYRQQLHPKCRSFFDFDDWLKIDEEDKERVLHRQKQEEQRKKERIEAEKLGITVEELRHRKQLAEAELRRQQELREAARLARIIDKHNQMCGKSKFHSGQQVICLVKGWKYTNQIGTVERAVNRKFVQVRFSDGYLTIQDDDKFRLLSDGYLIIQDDDKLRAFENSNKLVLTEAEFRCQQQLQEAARLARIVDKRNQMCGKSKFHSGQRVICLVKGWKYTNQIGTVERAVSRKFVQVRFSDGYLTIQDDDKFRPLENSDRLFW